MDRNDFTHLINQPDILHKKQGELLEKIIHDFPYVQSARAVHLKNLYNKNSFQYNIALKTTAAYTTDRSVLFDFITSKSFTTVHNELYQKKIDEALNIDIHTGFEIVSPEYFPKENTTNSEIKLKIGKPLDFSKEEKHSFQEWLQLSRVQPIKRENTPETNNEPPLLDDSKNKKLELIDKFIQTNPKISPIKQGTQNAPSFELNTDQNNFLMTETLARVYLEQKKYQRAIQAYQILILKYPEKSSLFANYIKEIEILQNNNN